MLLTAVLQDTEKQLLEYLSSCPDQTAKALDLAKSLDKTFSRRNINPILYGLQKCGFIEKVCDKPPTWKLSSKVKVRDSILSLHIYADSFLNF